jgi:hypothetical protein
MMTIAIFVWGHLARVHEKGHLRVAQQIPGALTFEPWKRRVSLDAKVSLRNSDRDVSLQPVSVDVLRYRVDGTRHDGQLNGRVVWTSGVPRAIRPGNTEELRVQFEFAAPSMPHTVDAEVSFRDEFEDEVRTRLRFESHQIH